MSPYPLIGMALLAGALMHAPAKAAPELNAFYDVFLSTAQRASDSDTWVCGSSGPSESPCFTDGAAQASVSFDQWGHQAGASATPGTLRAWASAEWPDLTSTPRFATAQAQIVDVITLRHPDLDPAWEDRSGTLLRVRYSVDGELNFSNAGTAAFTTIFSASAGSAWFEAPRFVGRQDAQGTVSTGYGAFDEYQWPPAITGNPFGLFETYVRMPFNAPITLTWTLLADAGMLPEISGTAGSAQARLDHTAVFLGIDIMESDGDGVLRRSDGATIHSASGYDWASPVPAPATAWLFAAGLLVLARRLAARGAPNERYPPQRACDGAIARSGSRHFGQWLDSRIAATQALVDVISLSEPLVLRRGARCQHWGIRMLRSSIGERHDTLDQAPPCRRVGRYPACTRRLRWR